MTQTRNNEMNEIYACSYNIIKLKKLMTEGKDPLLNANFIKKKLSNFSRVTG